MEIVDSRQNLSNQPSEILELEFTVQPGQDCPAIEHNHSKSRKEDVMMPDALWSKRRRDGYYWFFLHFQFGILIYDKFLL